jgi:DNA-binding MarR family transcriptional regulator
MPEPYRRKTSREERPSAAARGVVRVGPGFGREYPGGDARSTEAFATLARTGAACSQELERFVGANFELPIAAASVLAALDGATEPLTPSEIGEQTLIASATLTATLDLLERRAWVRRTPNPDDRRSTLVEITAAGRGNADVLLPSIHQLERSVLDTLSAGERVQLLNLLAKVLERLAELAAEPPQGVGGARVRRAGRKR